MNNAKWVEGTKLYIQSLIAIAIRDNKLSIRIESAPHASHDAIKRILNELGITSIIIHTVSGAVFAYLS